MPDAQATLEAVEAATGKPIEPEFRTSDSADVARVCNAASNAFDQYRAIDAATRAEFLDAIGDSILDLGDALLERAGLETGLPAARLTGERGRTVNQLKMFATTLRDGHWQGIRIDTALPDREPLPRPDLRLRKIPLGPVAVFGAANFPLAFSTAGGDTAAALAAGCPVIVKGHPAHPGTDELVVNAILRAAKKAGMPDGVFGHLRGSGHALGAELVRNPNIAAVGFTGSRSGGLALLKIAQQRPVPIPVYAEMSSINPVVLMPQALQRRGAALGKAFIQSLTMGAGQFCTNPGLILAAESAGLDDFIRAAGAELSEHQPQTMLSGSIREAFAEGSAAMAGHPAVEQLAASAAGDGVSCEQARLFATSATEFLADEALASELFGAASLVVRCKNIHEMRQALEQLEGQLTGTIHLDEGDHEATASLLTILERKVGRIIVNGWPTGVEVADAMVHGGPFPATSDSRTTSVGTLAIDRFLRPVCYQDLPDPLLPDALRDGSSAPKLLDGKLS